MAFFPSNQQLPHPPIHARIHTPICSSQHVQGAWTDCMHGGLAAAHPSRPALLFSPLPANLGDLRSSLTLLPRRLCSLQQVFFDISIGMCMHATWRLSSPSLTSLSLLYPPPTHPSSTLQLIRHPHHSQQASRQSCLPALRRCRTQDRKELQRALHWRSWIRLQGIDVG